MTRTQRARARRRHHRRRWTLNSITIERAWRRYQASGDAHQCMRLCPCATDPMATCEPPALMIHLEQPIMTRPQDWAASTRQVLIQRGAWQGRA